MRAGYDRRQVERGFMLLLVAVATSGFAWLIGPFFGAIVWGVIAAILFQPLNVHLLRHLPGRRNLAALLTLIAIVALVIIPAVLLGLTLISEGYATYGRFQAGEIDLAQAFVATEARLPAFVRHWLGGVGLTDYEALQATIGRGVADSFQSLARQALTLGQSTLGFFLELGVMLYLTFFLLRDGQTIIAAVECCLPLAERARGVLVARFVAVVRATIKGSVIVAVLQGLIGGLVFWALGIGGALIWGVAMGVFSLFPAVGTGLIWVPVTVYLFVTGSVWQAGVLLLCGFFIISSVDNVVRPILIGHDARMPDYVVLIATLGGFELIGFNGFVVGPVIAALFIACWQILSGSAADNENADTEITNPRQRDPTSNPHNESVLANG